MSSQNQQQSQSDTRDPQDRQGGRDDEMQQSSQRQSGRDTEEE